MLRALAVPLMLCVLSAACMDAGLLLVSAGGSLAGYKMNKRTSGLQEFQFVNIGAAIKVSTAPPSNQPANQSANQPTTPTSQDQQRPDHIAD